MTLAIGTSRGLLAAALVAVVSCGGSAAPQPSPTPTPAPTPTPTPAPGSFTITLPIRAADSKHDAFGLNPFGVHIGDHAADGHPGWDFEYVPGATVYAAADGTVQSVLPSEGGTAWGIQITHLAGGRPAYRTNYGVGTLASGVAAGASVMAAQALGIVSSYTRTIGRVTVTYGFTHFQLDDFSSNQGSTNTNAVSPAPFLTSDASRTFDAIWSTAFYPQELVEPFVANPRDVVFPMKRVWTLQSGSLAAEIEFTRDTALASAYAYVMRDGTGAAFERGTAEIEPLIKPHSTVDFVPDGQPRRLGVYSIVGGSMQLEYGAPGAPRPSTLGGAARYTTR